MRDKEQENFLNMIKRNEFIEVAGLEDDDESKADLDFLMVENNPIIIKQMYKGNLYLIIVHLLALEQDMKLKRPVLSIIRIDKDIVSKGIKNSNIILKKEPLSESVSLNIDVEEYNFEFIEKTGDLFFQFHYFEVDEEN